MSGSTPTWWDRFGEEWASQGLTDDPTLVQADAGWAYIGQSPPTVEQFNSTHQWWDAKDNWLFGQINSVVQQAGLTLTDSSLTTLRDAINSFFRKYLTTPLTLYVDTNSGDDNLGNGSSGAPWKTIQNAINYLYNKIDGGGQNIFIQLKTPGVYAPVSVRGYFNGPITIVGDVLNKLNYIIRNTAGPAVECDSNANLLLTGMSLEGTGTAGNYYLFAGAIASMRGAVLLYDQIAFGPCTTGHIYCSTGGIFQPSKGTASSYDIYGGAQYHIVAETGGIATVGGITTNVTHAVSFPAAFVNASVNGGVNCWSWNIVNKASITTPLSWSAASFGIINTQSNLGIFPTATGSPPTLYTLPTTGGAAGGLVI